MIKIEHLKKSFHNLEVLKDINLTLEEGQVVAIIGPSGTGKSTLLRCLNYLEKPDSGIITIDGYTVDLEKITQRQIYELRKKSAMVFQNYNLLKNMTAFQNIIEPMITVHKTNKFDAEKKAIKLLEKVGLLDKRDFYPSKMSGGQQQRIAIARAMAVNSKVILLDEPTSSLDPELIGEVLEVIKNLTNEQITMVIVTHEMKFAQEVADKMIFLEDGYVAGEGTPDEIFNQQTNKRICKFLNLVSENG